MPDVVGLLPTLAQTVAFIALIIVLAGFVSGIVAVGVLQIFARAAIQRRVLWWFFDTEEWEDPWRFKRSRWPRRIYGKWSGMRPRAWRAAEILRMPEPLLSRLYYRQITGQLMAAANAEASGGLGAGPTSVLDALARSRREERHPDTMGPAAEHGEPDSARLHAASRSIYILQAELGEANARAVSLWLAAIWAVAYVSAGIRASLGPSFRYPSGGFFLVLSQLGDLAVLLAVAALLAACSSAVGLATFNWLDRISAPR